MSGRRFDDAVDTAWGRFEASLERSLDQLGDGSLVIDVEAETRGEGSAPYVQFAGDDGIVRGEVSSNTFLDRACRLDAVQRRTLEALGWMRPDDEHPNWWVDVDRDDVAVLLAMAVGALRQAFGVVHPRFLHWKQETEETEDPFEFEIGFPTSPEELREMVDATVARHLDGEVTKDDDGDIAIRYGKVPLWIRVLDDCPTIRIFSHVVVNTIGSRQARIETDILNRQHRQLKFTVEERRIVATIDLPAAPFAAQHLRDMVDHAGQTLSGLADDLALRTSGRLFFKAVPKAQPPRTP